VNIEQLNQIQDLLPGIFFPVAGNDREGGESKEKQ